jgi:hypothetical protein
MAWDTLLVNGTNLADLAVIEDLSDAMGQPPIADLHIKIPGRAGAVFVAAPYEAHSFNVPMVILGDNRGDVNADLTTLRTLLDSRTAALLVTRRSTRDIAGVDYNVSEYCNAVVTSSWEVDYLGATAARVVVTMQNIDGAWTFGAAVLAEPA